MTTVQEQDVVSVEIVIVAEERVMTEPGRDVVAGQQEHRGLAGWKEPACDWPTTPPNSVNRR